MIGPVINPNYVVRFDSVEDMNKMQVHINCPVYYTERYQEPITKYVFVNALRAQKGSDASWEDNNEPPPECIEYSDDETERIVKSKTKQTKRKR